MNSSVQVDPLVLIHILICLYVDFTLGSVGGWRTHVWCVLVVLSFYWMMNVEILFPDGGGASFWQEHVWTPSVWTGSSLYRLDLRPRPAPTGLDPQEPDLMSELNTRSDINAVLKWVHVSDVCWFCFDPDGDDHKVHQTCRAWTEPGPGLNPVSVSIKFWNVHHCLQLLKNNYTFNIWL